MNSHKPQAPSRRLEAWSLKPAASVVRYDGRSGTVYQVVAS